MQREVEKHRDSIAMIVRDANGARVDIKRIDEIARNAKEKGDEVQTVVEKATKAQSDLTETAEFNLLLTRVNNDDRDAFDTLFEITRAGKEPFRSLAWQALINVASHTVGGVGDRDG